MTFDSAELWTSMARRGNAPYFFKNPEHITFDFDQGTPDPLLFPVDDFARIAREVIEEVGPRAMDYFDKDYGYKAMFLGWDPLREQIARYLGGREGRAPDIDEIIVVNGSAHGIGLAGNVFLAAGDAVVVEAATFPYALQYFTQAGATILAAEVDGDGMDPESVDERLQEAKRQGLTPKMIYTIPTGHLPTGSIMPLERRQRLLEIASAWNLVIVEDTIYTPFQYEGEKVSSLWSLDTEGRVLQSDAFSKTIAPGTRIGWMTASQSSIIGMAKIRQDLGASMWLMRILHQYLSEGRLEPHIETSVGVYREKRDAVELALQEHCSAYLSWNKPKAAFYYWMRLSDNVDWDRVREEMYRAGIAMRPGERFLGHDDGPKHLRMAFAHLPIKKAADGIAKFGEVLERCAS
jgi:2-aminoadipate transaminase